MSAAEIAQLEATVLALSAQRAVLGDIVVDTALAPLQARLAALRGAAAEPAAPVPPPPALAAAAAPPAAAAASSAQRLRLVTILFLDVVGSTALAQQLDPEEIHGVMDGTLSRGTTVVQQHGGRVLQYAGDNLLAVFGADESLEDDTERAVHCGLALLALGRSIGADVLRRYGHDGFNIRVGLHTGQVLLGGGVDAEGSIRGQPVNIAARMEQTAPTGALRISQDTYRQVRGLFDLEAQPPISVKGLAEPMVTYLVTRARPRAFRAGTRGIEGVDTAMVGRDGELQVLQQAFTQVLATRRLQVVSVVAEAGVGKSRLLYEFGHWAHTRGEPVLTLQGRAHPQTQGQPFGLLRDVLAWRLQIADSDPLPLARQKIEHGIAPLFIDSDGPELAQAHAHLLGHLIGLDFSASPHLRGILDDPQQVRQRAFHAAAQAFRRIGIPQGGQRALPIVLQLDDLHWADDGTLAFLQHLVEVNHDVPMLLLALTRPTLFERHADWPAEAAAAVHRRLDLTPLDRAASERLAAELLKKLPEVPAALSELLIGRAEGNPFYMEELVKMLVDQGALVPGAEQWTLHADRLLASAVPPSLTGVLQARLDSLPAGERTALQESSVIGLVFWDQALAALDDRALDSLPALVKRELALPRPEAVLDGVREYAFKHQFLHEVTYATLLKRTRRGLHAGVAAWLSARTGNRAADYLRAAAEHFDKAGDTARACEHYTLAAERARQRYAHEAALDCVDRGLALLDLDPAMAAADAPPGAAALTDAQRPALRWRLLDVRERTLDLQAQRAAQGADLAALRELADAGGDPRRRAEVALRRALYALRTGDVRGLDAAAREAMAIAESAGDVERRLNAQRLMAEAAVRLGDLDGGERLALDGLAQSQALGMPALESRYLNALSGIAARRDDTVAMLQHSQRATDLRRQLGDRRNEAVGLATQGAAWLELGALEPAEKALQQALLLHRAVGDRALEPIALANLSQLAHWRGDAEQARALARATVRQAEAVHDPELQAIGHWSLGQAHTLAGEWAGAQQAFDAAMALAIEADSPIQFDAAAGQARVQLAQAQYQKAAAAVAPLIDSWAPASGFGDQLRGVLANTLVQWTCCQVLGRLGDPRGTPMLAALHAHLEAQADRISDPALRASFWRHVPENAAVRRATPASASGP
jgi:class 3 adenylate cyclase/tetratricopeptide (TPR) repeat protein